jgi:hypothetical protein
MVTAIGLFAAASLMAIQDAPEREATGCGTSRLVTSFLLIVAIPVVMGLCAAFYQIYFDLKERHPSQSQPRVADSDPARAE